MILEADGGVENMMESEADPMAHRQVIYKPNREDVQSRTIDGETNKKTESQKPLKSTIASSTYRGQAMN